MTKKSLDTIDKDKQHKYWSDHVQEWKRSNLKQQAYCSKAGISYSSFVYWKGLLSPKESLNVKTEFVPVKVSRVDSGTTDISSEIKIKLTTGHVVYIPNTMEIEKISRLIQLLDISHA